MKKIILTICLLLASKVTNGQNDKYSFTSTIIDISKVANIDTVFGRNTNTINIEALFLFHDDIKNEIVIKKENYSDNFKEKDIDFSLKKIIHEHFVHNDSLLLKSESKTHPFHPKAEILCFKVNNLVIMCYSINGTSALCALQSFLSDYSIGSDKDRILNLIKSIAQCKV